ncbi:MAG: hypothetical protein E7Z90_06875 [Cyanobacteria bacterium SIG29]|nr:hypothetical protein [Cyanobacteria bacterium SIG29]
MSGGINSNDAWNKLLDLAKKVGGTDAVNNASVERMIKLADQNGDGLISFSEFQETYDNIEDEYLEAFEAIAGNDGDVETMSQMDIDAMTQTGNASGPQGSGGNGGSAPTGGGGPTGGNQQPEAQGAGDVPTGATAISASDLAGKDAATLQSDRASLTNDIASMRSQKDAAAAQARQEAETAKGAYDQANVAFDELMEQCEAQKEERSEAAQKVDEAQESVSTAEGAVSDQESTISDTQATIDAAQSNLSGLSEPAKFIYEEVSDGKGGTTTVQKDNPEYAAYLEKKAALEQEIAQAEQQLAEQEAVLADLETQLTDAQTALQAAQEAYVNENMQDEKFGPQLTQAQNDINTTKQEYDAKKSAENTIEAQWDAQIDILQGNLGVYNDAIAEAEREEAGNPVPDGYSIQDGIIVSDGDKDKHVLTPVENMDAFPEGAQPNENGEIVDSKGNVLGRVETDSQGNQQIYLREAAPLSDSEINDVVEQLLYGDGKKPAEDFWSASSKIDFSKINSYDMAEIEKLYNQQVEAHNATVEPTEVKQEDLPENSTVEGGIIKDAQGNQIGYVEGEQYFLDNKWQTFAEKVETVNTDGSTKNDIKGIDTVAAKLARAEGIEKAETSFTDYLESQGIDPSNTSGVLLDKYMNDYIQSQLDPNSPDYHERTLTDDQVTEVVDALLNGAEQNGEQLSASKVMSMYDFESLSPESLAKVVEQYNASIEQNGGKPFAEAVKFSGVSQDQMTHIALGLVENLDNPELAEVSQQTLEQLVEGELNSSNGSSPLLNAILDSTSSDVENLANVQKFIEDSGLVDKVADLLANSPNAGQKEMYNHYSSKLSEIMDKTVVSENDLRLAAQLSDGGKDVWDNLNIAEMSQDEVANLQNAYDALNGAGSFMAKLEEIYPQNGADIIKSAVDGNEVSEDDTTLSDGRDVEALIDDKMSTEAGFREEVDALLDAAQNGTEQEKADAMNDLAIIANKYGEDNFLAMYKSVYNEVPSEFSTIRENVAAADVKEANAAEAQENADRIQETKDEIEEIFAYDRELEDAGLTPTADHTQEVIDIINSKLSDEDLSSQEKIDLLNSLTGDYKEYVQAYLEGNSSVMDEVINSGDAENITNFVNIYNSVNSTGANDTTNYFAQNILNGKKPVDTILALYENATPEAARYLNQIFNTPELIQDKNRFGTETENLTTIYEKITAGMEPVEPKGKSGNPISDAVQQQLVSEYGGNVEKILQNLDGGVITQETATWLLQQMQPAEVIDAFRGMSNGNQEKYLSTLFGLYQ